MHEYRKEHFDGETTAKDEYSPDTDIHKTNRDAHESDGGTSDTKKRHDQSSEIDHVEPCKVVADRLKSNKALRDKDIKDIINIKDNFAATSRRINNEKRADTNTEYVEKHEQDLQETEKKALLDKEKQAQKSIDKEQNNKVVNNLLHDEKIQEKFASDAGQEALSQTGGEIILYILKPIYFELKDSIRNGLETGVHAVDFRDAIKVRFGRVTEYIVNSFPGKLTASAFSFLKSFVSTLIEAIIGCLTSIFKMVWRLLKEGLKIVMGSVAILKDDTKTLAEKGDAVMKLAAISVSAVAGIYIDGASKQLGIPEPWSMLFASVSSAVVASGMLYLLNRLDIFHAKKEMRRRRILEILDEMNEQIGREAKEPMVLSTYSYRSVPQIV